MIESVHAVDNLVEILLVEGLDAILVGPYDLSASMGIVAQFDHPKFKEMMNKIRSQCSASRIACGVHVIAYSADSIFLNYYSERPNIVFKNG